MIVYLDTSTVLRVLLRQTGQLGIWGTWETAYASELLRLEARRAIDRLRLERALDDEGVADAYQELQDIESAIGFIPLTRTILSRASMPMPTIIKTLDAIHLASALLFEESRRTRVLFATHDAKRGTAARAFGFRCIGLD